MPNGTGTTGQQSRASENLRRSVLLSLVTQEHDIRIDAPFATKDKSDVIRIGVELGVPLELTLSCMNPRLRSLTGASARQAPLIEHCGMCSKCRERRDAFNEARIDDPTRYAVQPIR